MTRPLRVNLPGPVASVRAVPASAGPGADGDLERDAAVLKMQKDLEAEKAALARATLALQRAAAEVRAFRDEVARETESNLVDLALAVARKVLAQEVQAGRYDVGPIVQAALEAAPTRREAVVHLNPADLERLEAAWTDASAAPGVHLAADPTLAAGECVVETAEGTVEARVEDALEQIEAALEADEDA